MTTYILNESKMFSDIADGIAIVINSETGIYYGMNSFGTAVFENILAGASIEDITASIEAMPQAPADIARAINDFIEQLVNFEILIEGKSYGSASIDSTVAQKDGFKLVAQEYSDAQELLLADPIHEVKNETGWQPDKEALETDEEAIKIKHQKMEK